MLSEKMKHKIKVYSVCCMNDDVKSGDVFDGVFFAEEPSYPNTALGSEAVCIHGFIAEDELLASAGNQRYFFSLKDGWGAQDRHLFAIKCGFFMDFGSSVTREDILALIRKPLKKKGTYASLAEHGRREQMKVILSEMRERGCSYV